MIYSEQNVVNSTWSNLSNFAGKRWSSWVWAPRWWRRPVLSLPMTPWPHLWGPRRRNSNLVPVSPVRRSSTVISSRSQRRSASSIVSILEQLMMDSRLQLSHLQSAFQLSYFTERPRSQADSMYYLQSEGLLQIGFIFLDRMLEFYWFVTFSAYVYSGRCLLGWVLARMAEMLQSLVRIPLRSCIFISPCLYHAWYQLSADTPSKKSHETCRWFIVFDQSAPGMCMVIFFEHESHVRNNTILLQRDTAILRKLVCLVRSAQCMQQTKWC
jgi:hypothetical protein